MSHQCAQIGTHCVRYVRRGVKKGKDILKYCVDNDELPENKWNSKRIADGDEPVAFLTSLLAAPEAAPAPGKRARDPEPAQQQVVSTLVLSGGFREPTVLELSEDYTNAGAVGSLAFKLERVSGASVFGGCAHFRLTVPIPKHLRGGRIGAMIYDGSCSCRVVTLSKLRVVSFQFPQPVEQAQARYLDMDPDEPVLELLVPIVEAAPPLAPAVHFGHGCRKRRAALRTGSCANCGSAAQRRCSYCQREYYCGDACWGKDWSRHRRACLSSCTCDERPSWLCPVSACFAAEIGMCDGDVLHRVDLDLDRGGYDISEIRTEHACTCMGMWCPADDEPLPCFMCASQKGRKWI
jgi:hypothetical protein